MYNKKLTQSIPAPGHYTIRESLNKRSFCIGEKLDSIKNLDTPGAGTYDPDPLSRNSNPRFSMGHKLVSQFEKISQSPGPGSYEDSAKKVKRACPNYGFGSSQRSDYTKAKQTPGPGEYMLPRKLGNAPGYAIQKRS